MIKIRLNDLPNDNGIIKQILVKQGEAVKTWQNILIVSCGDTDIAISTLFDGIIDKIYIAVGDKVNKGDVAFKVNINPSVTDQNSAIVTNINDNQVDLVPSINSFDNEQQLNKNFTAEFKNESESQLELAPDTEIIEIKKDESAPFASDNVKTIISDLQEKNATGTSRFREKILSKLNKNQSEQDLEVKNNVTENKAPIKPLSFREIIMSRVNNLQKEGSETELVPEKSIKKPELTSFRDNLAKKMDLIKTGKITNTSNLEEINEIISQETTKDINSKYEPTGYYDKSKIQGIHKNDKIASTNLQELVDENNAVLAEDKKKFNDDFELQKKNVNINSSASVEKNNSNNYFNYHPLNNSLKLSEQLTQQKNSLMFSYNEILANSKTPLVPNILPHVMNNDLMNEQNEVQQLNHLETRHKLASLRNNAVNALLISNRSVPHLNLNCEVDMNNVISLCEKLTSRSNNKLRLNVMVFLVKAISLALEEYPKINASYDQSTNELIIKKYHNIAIARQNSSGLQAAVMKFVEKLSIEQLAVEMDRSDQRIRAKKPLDNEFSDSTITIINFGISGAINGSLPIFSPNLAVIGIGKIIKKPIVIGKNLVIRHVANISLSVDQRAIDVYDAGQFLEVLKNTLEEPYILSLN